ncbi:MAG: leucine-rich repeat domain-containing protein [Muribaculaceae bacterium]|nr:leucine-rich repeat domain-containing protein [Muribaculaceae bacterium]
MKNSKGAIKLPLKALVLSLAIIFVSMDGFCKIIRVPFFESGNHDIRYAEEYSVTENADSKNDTVYIRSVLEWISDKCERAIIYNGLVDDVDPLGYLPNLKHLNWLGGEHRPKKAPIPVPENRIKETFGGMCNLVGLSTTIRLIPQFKYSYKLKSLTIVDYMDDQDTLVPHLGLLNKGMAEISKIGLTWDSTPEILGWDRWLLSLRDSVLYIRKSVEYGFSLLWYPRGKKATSFRLYPYAHGISPYALYYTELKEIIADGNNLRKVGEGAFAHSKVQTVTLGKNVEEIGDSAFWACDSLTTLTLNGDTPPTVGPNTFPPETYKRCTLVVPKASYTKYAGIAPWNKFHNMFSPAGVEDVATADGEGAAEYYTLMGVKVEEPVAGQLYICRRGSKAEKVVYRE